MRKKNMKLYDIFYNTNGRLSMVYEISNVTRIINYGGNIYYLTTGNVEYEPCLTITPEEFLKAFPIDRLYSLMKQRDFEQIKKDYLYYKYAQDDVILVEKFHSHIENIKQKEFLLLLI